MRTHRIRVMLTALVGLALAREAYAQPNQPDVLPREFDCMVGTALAGAKLFIGQTKCVNRCMSDLWKGLVSEFDCLPPDYGNETASCISIARSKMALTVLKKCTTGSGADCPECYTPGCGQEQADGATQLYAVLANSFVPGIFCERVGAAPNEQKCELTVAKSVAKEHQSITKCYRRCLKDARSGGDVTTCMPPATDPELIACRARVRTKASIAIDKICIAGAIPDCTYPDGALWASLTDQAVEPFVTGLFCAE